MAEADVWPELAVVVPTFRRNESLRAVLASLAAEPVRPGLVLVLDCSPESAAAPLAAAGFAPGTVPVVYIPLRRNAGPAGAFAFGVETLQRDHPAIRWMLCRGDDNPVSPGLVATLRNLARRTSDRQPAAIGISGGTYHPRFARSLRLDEALLAEGAILEVDYIPGYGAPTYDLRRLAAAGVNFDPGLFFGFEELSTGLRLREAGETLLVDGGADRAMRQRLGLLGLGPGVAEPGRRTSHWRTHFVHRNRLRVARRHARLAGVLRLALRSLAHVGRDAFRDRGEALATLHGLLDGLGSGPPRARYVPR